MADQRVVYDEIRSKTLARTAVAARFDEIVRSLMETRRTAGEHAPDDVTTDLVHDTVDGRRLTE